MATTWTEGFDMYPTLLAADYGELEARVMAYSTYDRKMGILITDGLEPVEPDIQKGVARLVQERAIEALVDPFLNIPIYRQSPPAKRVIKRRKSTHKRKFKGSKAAKRAARRR